MNFKSKKIRNKIPKVPKPSRQTHIGGKKKITIGLPVITSIVIILLLGVGIVKAFGSIDFTLFLRVAGDELQKDGFGHTNFLLLGTGGKEHEGGNLTDTIIVASLDNENKLVTMVSIPRDLYVKDTLVGSSRINESYYRAKSHYGSSAEGLDHMKKRVEEIVGVPIHYWIKVDFQGFKDLIDAIGGVDLYVNEAIHDPYYPKDGTFLYETFSLSAGEHHMDGETALKYARSRKTTSDFDRAERQQELLFAIKEQALKSEIIFSTEKITNILNTLKANIETNIQVKEILTLGSMITEYNEQQISHRLIHDDPSRCGGFLYTPDRQLYGGQFVLLPAGGFEFLHFYSDLNFNLANVAHQNTRLHILNGTKTGGIAGEAKQILQRYCFDVVRFGNGRNQEVTQTTYYYQPKLDEKGQPIKEQPLALTFLMKLIPGQVSTEIPQEYLDAGYHTATDLILEIGSDYADSENYLDDPFYYLPAITPATPAASTETTTESTETTTEAETPATTPKTTPETTE